mmetsp:Transcript_137591/g.427423  ORF Transcript_137591/g.427423 Transcript_137591/m.427423 type:complete len:219 (+) Transcript_137591:1076-1732(+)
MVRDDQVKHDVHHAREGVEHHVADLPRVDTSEADVVGDLAADQVHDGIPRHDDHGERHARDHVWLHAVLVVEGNRVHRIREVEDPGPHRERQQEGPKPDEHPAGMRARSLDLAVLPEDGAGLDLGGLQAERAALEAKAARGGAAHRRVPRRLGLEHHERRAGGAQPEQGLLCVDLAVRLKVLLLLGGEDPVVAAEGRATQVALAPAAPLREEALHRGR